jgi:hypothetical protein
MAGSAAVAGARAATQFLESADFAGRNRFNDNVFGDLQTAANHSQRAFLAVG